MKVTVGRTVHYRVDADVCYAAIVTSVQTGMWYGQDTGEASERESVSLNIMPPMREMYQREAMQGDRAGTWHWPEMVQ